MTLLLLLAGALAAEPVCRPCHAREVLQHAASPHAGALYHAAQHPLRDRFGKAPDLRRSSDFLFRFDFSDAGKVRATDSKDVMELPLEWAFGSGQQAVTFVTRVNQEFYVEHYGSYYPALQRFGATPGQDVLKPDSLARAAGVLYPLRDRQSGIDGCFACHSTGPVNFDAQGQVQLGQPGVQCQACHADSAAHVANPDQHRPANPGKLSAEGLNDFCGRCHRPPASAGTKPDWNYAWNVRHQPLYLAESRCFVKSKGKLSCLTCHDPHQALAKQPSSFYNQKCEACHPRTKPVCRQQSPANCIDCHMPAVTPQSPLRFSNHWIGVYGEGAKLKPLR